MSRNDNENKNGSIKSATTNHDDGDSGDKNKNHKRMCHIVKRTDFDGYGFNLHSEKGKPGQFIGKVDENSPAEEAGLKQGDRIIEVNGLNIGSETHKQVVQRIKAIPDEVRLLVIDPELEKQQKSTTTTPTPTTPSAPMPSATIATSTNNNINNNNNNNNNIDVTTNKVTTTSSITVQSTKIGGAKLTPVSTPVAPPKIEDIKSSQASAVTNSPATATASIYAGSLSKPSSPTFTSTMTINSNNVNQSNNSNSNSNNSNNSNSNNNNNHKDATSIGSGNSDITDGTIEASPIPIPTTANGNHKKNGSNDLKIDSSVNMHHQSIQQSKNNGNTTAVNANMKASSAMQQTTLSSSTTTTTTTSTPSNDLNLPMTAAEMRAKLLAKKKYDPKNDNVDLRKKFEIIQKL